MVLDIQHVNDCKTKQQDFCSDDKKKKLTKEKRERRQRKNIETKKRRRNYIERSVFDNFLTNFFFCV